MRTDDKDILTVGELAERLQLASSWIYANADSLGAYRLGKYLRFSWRRVLARLEGSPTTHVGIAVHKVSV
jgi:hypothetical protein